MDAFEIGESDSPTTSIRTSHDTDTFSAEPYTDRKRSDSRTWRFSRALMLSNRCCLVLFQLNKGPLTGYHGDKVCGVLFSKDAQTLMIQYGIYDSQCSLRDGIPRHWIPRVRVAETARAFLLETMSSSRLNDKAPPTRDPPSSFGNQDFQPRTRFPEGSREVLREWCRAEHLDEPGSYCGVVAALLPESIIVSVGEFQNFPQTPSTLYNWLGCAFVGRSMLEPDSAVIGATSKVSNWWLHLRDFLSFEKCDVLTRYSIRTFILKNSLLYTETLLESASFRPRDTLASFYLPSVDLWRINRHLAQCVLIGDLIKSNSWEQQDIENASHHAPVNLFEQGRQQAISSRDPMWHPQLINERLQEEGKSIHRRRELLNSAKSHMSLSKCFLMR